MTSSDANLAYTFCLDQVQYAERLFSKENLAILSNCVKTKQRESKALVGDDSIAEPAGSRGGHMTERTNGHGMYPWGRLVLFVLFLIFLAIVLKAMGWCVGGVCDVGLDALLK